MNSKNNNPELANSIRISQQQQCLDKYFASPLSATVAETKPKITERKVLPYSAGMTVIVKQNSVSKVDVKPKNISKPLIITEMKFDDHPKNSLTPVQTIDSRLPEDCRSLDIAVIDIGTPKMTKKVDSVTHPSIGPQQQNQKAGDYAPSLTVVDLCDNADSDDEPIAKKIKIDAKKYEKIKNSLPKAKSANSKAISHFERAFSAVLKQVRPNPPKKRSKGNENNDGKEKQMPQLEKQVPLTVKQKLLGIKCMTASPGAKPPFGQNLQGAAAMKPLNEWIQAGKILLKNSQGFTLKNPFLPLTRLDGPKFLTPSGVKLQQKGVFYQAPNKFFRLVAPPSSSSGQGPSFSGKVKTLKPLEKTPTAHVIAAALKAQNILISPISRDNVVKNNLARLEAKWKACQGTDQKMLHHYRTTAGVVLSILNKNELEQIKDEALKKDILYRYQLHHEKIKLKKMTAEERKVYFQQKHKDEMERRKIQQELTKVKYEDAEISSADNLPHPQLYKMPDGLSNGDFGDVLMVTDFLLGFSELLTPQERLDVNIDSVLQALSTVRTTGYEFLAKMLVAFLETLLQTESHVEMGTRLEDITVNCYTASELTRLISNSSKGGYGDGDDETDSGFDASSSFNEALNDECVETLRTADLYTLPPRTILDILIFVQNKLLQAQNFDEFLREKEEELTEAWKEKQEALQELKKYKSTCVAKKLDGEKVDEKEAALKQAEKDGKPNAGADMDALTITHFYGSSPADTKPISIGGQKVVADMAGTSSTPVEKANGVGDKSSRHGDTLLPVSATLSSSDNDENDVTSDVDSMVYKVKNRRILMEQMKVKKAEQEQLDKERKRKEMELQSRENRVIAASKKLNNLQEFLQVVVRRSPIGLDRNYSRYWIFPKSAPGYLFVEKVFDKQNLTVSTLVERTSNFSPADQWFYYNDVTQYENLLANLLKKGVRESQLGENMQKQRDKILACLSKPKKEADEEPPATNEGEDVETMYKKFLQNELSEMENKIRHGGLGGVSEFDVWSTKLSTARTIDDYGDCLLEVRENIRPSLLKGIMGPPPKKGSSSKPTEQRRVDAESEGEGKEEKSGSSLDDAIVASEELKKESFSKQWHNAVKECKTWSRLAVLFYILHSCIMWEKSVENAPCKICRRRRDDENTILCDECNDCYHIYCLRPPLKRIPLEDWFCVKCKPANKKKKSVRYAESSDEEDMFTPANKKKKSVRYFESSDEEEEDDKLASIRHDDVCVACESGEIEEDGDLLVYCSSCPCAFHMDCHKPPLRHTPRSGWKCCVCVKGVTFNRQLRKRRR